MSDPRYYIYSSKAGKSEGPKVKVLAAGSQVDDFISKLKNQVIILKDDPTEENPGEEGPGEEGPGERDPDKGDPDKGDPDEEDSDKEDPGEEDPKGDLTADFDATDEWAKWFGGLDPSLKCNLSMKVHRANAKDPQSFQCKFTAPWTITFSSGADALLLSFGGAASFVIGGDLGAKIPPPGIDTRGVYLIYGYKPQSKQEEIKSTIKDLFRFASLDLNLLASFPKALHGLNVTLDSANTVGKRNALWFNPGFAFQVTIRLQFSLLNGMKELQEHLTSALPGFEIQSADVVVKKAVLEARGQKGLIPVDRGSVVFGVVCAIKAKAGTLNFAAGIEYIGSSVQLKLQLNPQAGQNSLAIILSWLGELIGVDLGFVTQYLEKDGIFENINLRRVKVTLDPNRKAPRKLKLTSVEVTIEVRAKFGRQEGSAPVAFLIQYRWSSRTGGFGFLMGRLWNSFDLSDDRKLSPEYEVWDDLVPSDPTTVKTIDLERIVPGQEIQNIPENIPSRISNAQISLSDSKFAVRAAIETKPGRSPGTVPQPSLDRVQLQASYSWGAAKDFEMSLAVNCSIRPSKASKNQTPAILQGSITYNSKDKSWIMSAKLRGLYASVLYEFFDASSADHVIPLIDSISIRELDVTYEYKKQSTKSIDDSAGGEEGSKVSKSSASSFKIKGDILISALELTLSFEHADDWSFAASLKPQDEDATLKEIVQAILEDDDLELPDFLDQTLFKAKGASFDMEIKSPPSQRRSISENEFFQFYMKVELGPIYLVFVQYHGTQWKKELPSKRLFKIAVSSLPKAEIPLVGDLTQPFDEMYYMWVQDATKLNASKSPGITRSELKMINDLLGTSSRDIIIKDKFKEKTDADILIGEGSHLAVVIQDPRGAKSCILAYDFMKPGEKPAADKIEGSVAPVRASGDGDEHDEDEEMTRSGEKEGDNEAAHAPLQKKAGPLSISSLGLKYSKNILEVKLDATMELGPLTFTLIGFSIKFNIAKLDDPKFDSVDLEGLSAAFERPPLTIAGLIRHKKTETLDYYAGGMVVGFVPYEFQAAGFYGKATPENGKDSFTSVFIFAKLNGPLVTFAFAEISGVTGGFGYNSEVRLPKVDEVVNFPFVAPKALDGKANDTLKTLEKITDPEDGWFRPLDSTYWAAAGLKVDAFQMLSIDAVVVVQFGAVMKLGIFAVAIADIPKAASKIKFAHIELGIAITVDFDYGVFKAEAQLSPQSFILHPDCHLTGGFALFYWFDAPRADKSRVGDFVFTIGGYHQAFEVPLGWPNPPRLGISWSLGSTLSITGQAYFAITPKVCMGGGRLYAAFSAGPIKAWFDAFADFLINYQPFFFTASAQICVGVQFDIDFLFIHTQIRCEIGAGLDLWGPPLAGRVHVDFWITSFDIYFGQGKGSANAISMLEFYRLALQGGEVSKSDSPKRDKNEAHVFLAHSGLMNDSEGSERQKNAPWVVRAGIFSFVISCKMPVDKVARDGEELSWSKNGIYGKPMRLTSAMTSTMTVSITHDGSSNDEWQAERVTKVMPSGLWSKYDADNDPSAGRNGVSDLLDVQDGGVELMAGVQYTAPKARLSPDILPKFNIKEASLQQLTAKRPFPQREDMHSEHASAPPIRDGKGHVDPKQWDTIQSTWANGGKNLDGQKGFVDSWAKAFGWGDKLSTLSRMPTRHKSRFKELYVAAPLLSK